MQNHLDAIIISLMLKLCWDLGGYLAEIQDQEQENQIDTFVNLDNHYWLGLNDFSTEGKNSLNKTRYFRLSVFQTK